MLCKLLNYLLDRDTVTDIREVEEYGKDRHPSLPQTTDLDARVRSYGEKEKLRNHLQRRGQSQL